MSSGSPMTSDSTTENTCAGAHSCANRPPLTAERRLRTVFISTMSAPLASSCFVTDASAPPSMSGLSNSALPPPESRNNTRSSAPSGATRSMAACVAAKEFSSGTGWPASYT